MSKAHININLQIEYMDTKFINNEEYLEKLYDTYKYKYKNTQLDLIMVSDDDAFNFVLENEKSLFSNIPIVFCGVNYGNFEKYKKHKYIAGVIERIDVESTLKLIKKFNRNINHVVIINDKSITGQNNKKIIEKSIDTLKKDIKFDWIEDLSIGQVENRVSKLSGNSAILLMTYNTDGEGKKFTYEEIIKRIYAHTDVPIYSVWSDIFLGKGIVGGKLTNGYNEGREAAIIAQKILFGESSYIIKKSSFTKYMFDYKELKKYNIKLSDLPKDSTIINDPYDFYKQHRMFILGTLIFISFLILFIIYLIVVIYQRRKAEKSLLVEQANVKRLNEELEIRVSKRTQDLEESNKELKNVLESLKETQEQLIQSKKMAALSGLVAGVAHEINTPLGVAITAITYLKDQTLDFFELYKTNKIKKSELDRLLSNLQECIEIIFTNLIRASSLVKSFKQVSVDQTSEILRNVYIKSYIEEILLSLRPKLKNTKLVVNIECKEDLKENIYPGALSQIITNFIMNSINHGYEDKEEGKILICCYKEDNDLIIQYTDDGRGISQENIDKIFEPFFTTNRTKGGSGLGLNIVYNIVTQKLKGSISCYSKEGKGVFFEIKFPI